MAIKLYYYGGTMIAWFKITFIILSDDPKEKGAGGGRGKRVAEAKRRKRSSSFLQSVFLH